MPWLSRRWENDEWRAQGSRAWSRAGPSCSTLARSCLGNVPDSSSHPCQLPVSQGAVGTGGGMEPQRVPWLQGMAGWHCTDLCSTRAQEGTSPVPSLLLETPPSSHWHSVTFPCLGNQFALQGCLRPVFGIFQASQPTAESHCTSAGGSQSPHCDFSLAEVLAGWALCKDIHFTL